MAVIDDVASEFDVQRKKATQAVNANVQAKRDAISRAAARSGGGPGGAFVRVEQKAIDEGGRQLADANESINASQSAEMRRLREIDEGRKYQTSERLGSQDFAAGQADLGRKFTTGERLGSQEWQGGQADKQRTWQTGERVAGQGFAHDERLGGQEFTAGEAEKGRTFATSEREKGQDWQHLEAAYARDTTERIEKARLAQAADQFEKTYGISLQQLAHEKYVDDFNMDLAKRIQSFNEKNPGLLASLLGGSGLGGLVGGGPLGGAIGGPNGTAIDVLTGGFLNPGGAVGTAVNVGRKIFGR